MRTKRSSKAATAYAAAMAGNNLAKERKQILKSGARRGLFMAAAGNCFFLWWLITGNHPADALFCMASWTLICLFGQVLEATYRPKFVRLTSGLDGESRVFKLLASLSDEYIVLNQVLLPNARSRTGHTEADFVLIGKKALYLVETKNNASTIKVTENGHEWDVTTPNGDATTMRNPVRQVKIQAKVLAERLAEKGIEPIIQPTVAFSSPVANLVRMEDTSVPVFTYPLKDLAERIVSYEEEKLANYPMLDQEMVKGVLDELQKQALRAAEEIMAKRKGA